MRNPDRTKHQSHVAETPGSSVPMALFLPRLGLPPPDAARGGLAPTLVVKSPPGIRCLHYPVVLSGRGQLHRSGGEQAAATQHRRFDQSTSMIHRPYPSTRAVIPGNRNESLSCSQTSIAIRGSSGIAAQGRTRTRYEMILKTTSKSVVIVRLFS